MAHLHISHFDDLLTDLNQVSELRRQREGREVATSYEARADAQESMEKAFSPAARRQRAADNQVWRDSMAASVRKLEQLKVESDARRGERDAMLRKSLAPDFGQAREILVEAARNGAPVARVAQVEAQICRMEAGQWMGKAMDHIDMPDSDPHNVESNRARAHPVSTDTHSQLRRAGDLLSQLRSEGKITAAEAATFEQKLIRAHDAESAVRQDDPSTAERRAATQKAGGLLRDLARAGGLGAVEVAGLEAQVHQLENSFGMGSA